MGGQTGWMIPDRGTGVQQKALPPEYQRIFTVVRKASEPVAVRQVGEVLGLDVGARGKLEPLREKLRKLADRGWLHKRPDGKLAGDTVDADALVVQGVDLGVKEWRRERDVLPPRGPGR